MFKVVKQNLTSFIAFGKWTVQYKIGEFVYPNIPQSKLFVYDNFRDALDYARFDKDLVFEVEVINPTRIFKFPSMNEVYSDFWNKQKVNHHFMMESYNTYVCDAVKLVKLVTK